MFAHWAWRAGNKSSSTHRPGRPAVTQGKSRVCPRPASPMAPPSPRLTPTGPPRHVETC